MKVAQLKISSPTTTSRVPFFKKESPDKSIAEKKPPFFNYNSIQPKLTIGQPNDPYEKEADAMADQVVQRLDEKEIVQTKPLDLSNSITPLIQPKCEGCEEEEKLQKKEEDKSELKDNILRKPIFESNTPPPEEKIQRKCTECEKEKKVQRKGGGLASPSIETQLNSSKGSGSSLPDNTRQQMESSFGADFSGVKIHTGSSAIQMSKNLNAQAFTRGSDIYFNGGKYDDKSKGGLHLLSHELTHVVQQGSLHSDYKISKKENSIQRAVSTLCNAPSSWGMAPPMWITIGMLAHLIGMNDYLIKTGGVRNLDVYLDTFELLPIDPNYAAFIIRNNPGLDSWKQVFLSYVPIKRPDYMIHRPGMTEFDELKPSSIPGVSDGMTKIYEISGYMHALGLPYRFGTSYTPTSMIPLFSFTFGGMPVDVALKFTRLRSGLIVYEICITTDWAQVAIGALLAILAIILAFLLRRFPMPNPAPVPVIASNGNTTDTNNTPNDSTGFTDLRMSSQLSQIV